jgi:hypothetical protein
VANERPSVVGREPELHLISTFHDESDSGPAALVLQGSAGIGKTTSRESKDPRPKPGVLQELRVVSD